MPRQHRHDFVETYTGPLAQGLDRETDLDTLKVYLQKFSDDDLLDLLLPRLSDQDMDGLFEMLARLLRRRLNEEEYHRLFLRDLPGD